MLFSRPQIFFQLGLDFLAGLQRRKMCATCAIGHADAITLIFFKNSHKAPPKSLGRLRLRELRRQSL